MKEELVVKKNNTLSVSKVMLVLVIFLFSVLTVFAVYDHGFVGIFSEAFRNYASMQVFFDLFIALVLIMVWMWHDAKKSKRLFWPWAIITLAVGVFGPLFYLLFRKEK